MTWFPTDATKPVAVVQRNDRLRADAGNPLALVSPNDRLRVDARPLRSVPWIRPVTEPPAPRRGVWGVRL